MPPPLDMTKLVKPLEWEKTLTADGRPQWQGGFNTCVTWFSGDVFRAFNAKTDHKMREDAIAAETADHAARVIDALDADLIAELVGALGWYASDAAWTVNQIVGADGDYGAKARAILARLGVTP